MKTIPVKFIDQSAFERASGASLPDGVRLPLIARMARLNTLSAIKLAGSGHMGSSFSSMDIFVYLYFRELNLREKGLRDPGRDIFFSSKGHDCPGQYAAMAAAGFLPLEKLMKLRRIDGLEGHPHVSIPGMEANTGSLGMGISKAKGMAFAMQKLGRPGRVMVLTGDGEFQEGQIWESLQTAVHQRINNLFVIIDANGFQTDKHVSRIVSLGGLEDKLRAFSWHVEAADGHDFGALGEAFRRMNAVQDRPRILIAKTVKGKGISFMEGPREAAEGKDFIYNWHSGAPSDEAYEAALAELEAAVKAGFTKLGLGEPALIQAGAPQRSVPADAERLVAAYGKALVELGAERPDLVVLDADLSADCGLRPFEEKYPERFLENGIAEQDMVSAAGGMALQGLLPVVNSFGCFLAARACEQIYNNATEETKIIYAAHYAGLLPAGAGRSHQSVRDVALFGHLPNVTAIEPCNEEETRAALRWCVLENPQSSMLRLVLIPSPSRIKLPGDYRFAPGKGALLADGEDAAVFAYGPILLHEALQARALLQEEEISLKVFNMPWLNCVDEDWFREACTGVKAVFSVDNHFVSGGLGDRLEGAFNRTREPRQTFRKIGVTEFPACGTPAEVLAFHGLDAAGLAAAVRETLLASAPA